ncbi:undecaprenyldiphospho-muramoylpentapeptide beta-N-acetylglucosaminyltransferase [Aureibacter tunicatorum]|uniref:UDP-N-acetylglucosamine--N-acetylmuramyl-(pentapeptide) pyrophosphoryl-undecaprenol N-acetylglucosamine transferase n=1 Tax=Aureibacter tunicatorum TaxID=866807 RepID=A0AAE4BUM8_9BACT|nr:undecaprenyldiphospho-muramoylpentapeptide beta-N-acetylglucosaminyltransferase [Aureibacter tunicatorum]MDR6241240.1 UDP-N-acetylglucosamine--N-acetylmuramyl-(pentapeptide) pyrophosphoryl-undecaprenol N-acetylglucosamine transferase [Aureibacter tunicatorum]BDD03500.1 UDP-N-acetylglucosamine--N-acetylmuramyl-(pentapeptide) pyrophosphoryl-undecaprenol N-acetylglucosamine transferase [Aureibacter tunicatorum]
MNRVIISGGGTGGHINPALAIANEIKKRNPQAEILFVGAKGRMEMERVPKAGYEIKGLWIDGIQRSLSFRNLMFPLKLIVSLIHSWLILRKFKPEACIGVGGFASGPLLYMATVLKIPTLIQEQNSYAGLTNKLLGNRIDKVCAGFEKGMERYFPKNKVVATGNPVREDLVEVEKIDENEALNYFGLQSNRPVLLVIGGSLGAKSVNLAMSKCVKNLLDQGLQVIWQTGKFYYDAIVEEQANLAEDPHLKIMAFVERMDFAYRVADVVVSRAGALSIAELEVVGKPSIFVPSPNVAEDHQTKNAESLLDQNACLLVKDSELDTKLEKQIIDLVENTSLMKELADNMNKVSKPYATKKIVDEIEKLKA